MEKSNTVNSEHTSIPETAPEAQAGGVSPSSPSSLGERAGAGIQSSSSAGEAHEGRQASDEAQEELQKYADTAKEAVQSAKEKGKTMLEERKQALADEVSGIERALRRTATELRDEDRKAVGRYAEQVADGLEQVSHALREQDFDSLIEKTEDFARRQPGVFLGGAVAAGFLLARFLKSSGKRVTPVADSSGAPYGRPADYSRSTGQSAYETAGANPHTSYSGSTVSPSVESNPQNSLFSDRDLLRGAE
ncbi:MAG: hypothetical protein WAN46_07870 [Gammaproteobacteria bacterium]|jgi:ElaB/YqjD/DUF883 family membrane-anchored ribosome-binding protein